jgi:hypothetical protein
VLIQIKETHITDQPINSLVSSIIRKCPLGKRLIRRPFDIPSVRREYIMISYAIMVFFCLCESFNSPFVNKIEVLDTQSMSLAGITILRHVVVSIFVPLSCIMLISSLDESQVKTFSKKIDKYHSDFDSLIFSVCVLLTLAYILVTYINFIMLLIMSDCSVIYLNGVIDNFDTAYTINKIMILLFTPLLYVSIIIVDMIYGANN